MTRIKTTAVTTGMIGLSLLAYGLSAPLAAQNRHQNGQNETPSSPTVLQRVYDCQAISDGAARLACFDQQVTTLRNADNAHDIRVIARDEVRRTRRGLFGFSLPNIGGLFGDSDDNAADEDRVTEISSTVTGLTTGQAGRRVFVLENGQQWIQIYENTGGDVAVGTPIVIRRTGGLRGGYQASVAGQSSIRVRRVS